MLPFMVGAAMAHETSGPPHLAREFRGVWVATVDNIDWPSKPGLAPDVQKKELRSLLTSVAGLHFNAVVFQVRPSADALYVSKLEPSSWYLTGQQGKPIEFDPLKYAVAEGHRLGLEVHAWFNPFRAGHPAQKGPYCAEHVTMAHPDWVRTYGKYKWLDPGVPEAREHSYRVFMDLLDRYDVDGIHIDDYFYPYPENNLPFPDQEAYLKYRSGPGQSVSEWRRANIDGFVQTLYQGIKAHKPWVKFGISPFGIYRPNVPTGVTAGVDQYEDLAADALKWFQEGWCDYLSPQIYWKTDTKGHAFGTLLDWWSKVNTKKRHLWPGMYTGQLEKGWTTEEIAQQIHLTRVGGSATGQVHFSAKVLLSDVKGIRKALLEGPYKAQALVPESGWIKSKKPSSPVLTSPEPIHGEISWSERGDDRFYVVWEKFGGEWRLQEVTSDARISSGGGKSPRPEAVSVTAVSRTGQESDPLVVGLEKGR